MAEAKDIAVKLALEAVELAKFDVSRGRKTQRNVWNVAHVVTENVSCNNEWVSFYYKPNALKSIYSGTFRTMKDLKL
jgi:hypothetical protein